MAVFKAVRDDRPYPDHGYSQRQWAGLPPRAVRLDHLISTRRHLDLERLLADDSTYYTDVFAHVVAWRGELYLEDGLHRAVRAALEQRTTIHARLLQLQDAETTLELPVVAPEEVGWRRR